MYIIYHRLCVLWIALLLIMLLIPHIVVGSDQSESVCNPLPEGQRFSAVGYELGVCLKDVEALVKSNGYTLTEETYSDDENSVLYRNRKIYTLIKSYTSNFADVVLPLKEELRYGPIALLSFYKNILYDISLIFSYPENTGSDVVKIVPEIIAKKVTERIGIPPTFDENSKRLKWNFKNIRIQLELSSISSALGVYGFFMHYTNLPIEKQAEQYKTEIDKKRRQKEETNTSGF